MSIRNRPNTPEYEEGYERIFGKKENLPLKSTQPPASSNNTESDKTKKD